MTKRAPGSARVWVAGLAVAAAAAGLAALALEVGPGLAGRSGPAGPPVAVGGAVQVIPGPRREAAGLPTWPDGTMGVVVTSHADYYIASDGGRGVATTTGTPTDPLAGGVRADVPISDLRTGLDYAAGGPVYVDPASGRWLLWYHAERWPGGNAADFYSAIGMAQSTDEGRTWRDLGLILTSAVPYDPSARQPVEMGGAPFVVTGGYFYVYFRDVLGADDTAQFGVAHAPVASVVGAAVAGGTAAWHDYYEGGWKQPGLGGRASPLEAGNPDTRWFDVAFDPAISRFVAAIAADDDQGVNLYLAFSLDGLHWTSRQRVTSDQRESFYPSLVGPGPDPQTLGATVYLYYTDSPLDRPRWAATDVDRLTLSL